MEYLFAGLIVLFIIAIVFIKSPKGKGKIGEFGVDFVLGENIKYEKYKIDNFSFIIEDKTVQIDHLFLNENGIFVIETKNYRGRIYGDEDSKNWTQVFNYGKNKYSFYNPIKQNKSHIYYLKQLLKDYDINYNSIIVFFDNTTRYIKSSTPVIRISQLKNTIASCNSQKKISSEEIDKIYNFLINYKSTGSVKLKDHIQNINKRLTNIERNICPRCQNPLVERKSKYGSFFGCSNYPKCKFIKK